MIITKRDKEILEEVYRWNGLLSRQIQKIGCFGKSNIYRRLKLLVDNDFLKRKRYVYGIPSLYTITSKGSKEIGKIYKNKKINTQQLNHSILTVDIYLRFKYKLNLSKDSFFSEYELRKVNSDGKFEFKTHHPDFYYIYNNKKYCVEVELTLKNEYRLQENIKENFHSYDYQFWVVPKNQKQIQSLIKKYMNDYPNMELILLEDIISEKEKQ